MADLSTLLLEKLARAWQVYVDSLPALAQNFGWVLLFTALVMLMEWALVDRKRTSLARILGFSGSVRNDLTAAALKFTGLNAYVGMALTFGVAYLIAKSLRSAAAGWDITHYLSPTAAGLAFFLLADFTHYWFHRASHSWRIHWSIHKFHHSANQMTLANAYREHPLGAPLGSIWIIFPFTLAPPPDYLGALLLASLLIQLHGLITHSNIPAAWGPIGNYLLVSPATHRMHHGRAEELHNSNYGGTLIIWDRLFGTWQPPKGLDIAGLAIGLDDDPGDIPPLQAYHRAYLETLRNFRTTLQSFGRAMLSRPCLSVHQKPEKERP